MKVSKILGTLTLLLGCIAAVFLTDLPKVIRYRRGDIKDFNMVEFGELQKGDLVKGTIDWTDGCIAEEEETNSTFGIETSKRTTGRYYAVYTMNGSYLLYQTGRENEYKKLDQMGDEAEAYYEARTALEESEGEDADVTLLDTPETTMDFTGEVIEMPSDLRPIFEKWYGEGFEDECETDIVIRTSNFDRFSWVIYAGAGCAAGALLMLVLTIMAFVKEKRNQQYGY